MCCIIYTEKCARFQTSPGGKSHLKGARNGKKKAVSNAAGGVRVGVGGQGPGDAGGRQAQGHGRGAAPAAPLPVAQHQLLGLAPRCRGPPALDSPVTPVPALAAVAPAVSHPAPRGKSSDYPNTVIKGEMCF